MLFLVVVGLLEAGSVRAQSSDEFANDWPGFRFGYTPGLFYSGINDGQPFEVDFMGLVSTSVADNRLYRDFAPLRASREQAQAFKDFYRAHGQCLSPSYCAILAAETTGDEETINAAHRHHFDVSVIARDMKPSMFKNMVVNVTDQDQLETMKSLSVNVVLERAGFEKMLQVKADTIAAHGLSREELGGIAKAMVEAELELQKEIIHLRRKAWDNVMATFPPELVKQREEEMGFGGLENPK